MPPRCWSRQRLDRSALTVAPTRAIAMGASRLGGWCAMLPCTTSVCVWFPADCLQVVKESPPGRILCLLASCRMFGQPGASQVSPCKIPYDVLQYWCGVCSLKFPLVRHKKKVSTGYLSWLISPTRLTFGPNKDAEGSSG